MRCRPTFLSAVLVLVVILILILILILLVVLILLIILLVHFGYPPYLFIGCAVGIACPGI